jgi:aspartyl-tRNA synthetase
MYRTHTCGELTIKDIGKKVELSGWVQTIRDMGKMIWIDLRDYYGITQLLIEKGVTSEEVINTVSQVGREYVVNVSGKVIERLSKNFNIPTGEIEIKVLKLDIVNSSKIPPFTIEDNTDGGDDLRMKFRYLDIRRNNIKKNLQLRHRISVETRKYLNQNNFLEVETPYLINSTPEGARDFVVPSRMNPGEFYALPQSPQTFKQLLMVSGIDRYYQIVRCFRDEDLRADRQPEFTQIDCEMSFVDQEDVLNMFEGLAIHLFREVIKVNLCAFPRMTYHDAMKFYGTDKPDIRFDMKFVELNDVTRGKGFNVFDDAELVVGICASGCAEYTRKQLDELTEFVKKPQIGAKGLVYIKFNSDCTYKSSVDKFFSEKDLQQIAQKFKAKSGDLLLIMAGEADKTRKALSELRLEMADRLNLRERFSFSPLWVIDFPLLEWDEETQRYYAKHHPFTSPRMEDIELLKTDPASVRANAYDLVVNGIEIGGGSIRIFHKEMQELMFNTLGITAEDARKKFGFLLNAFEYGAPPHGGIAFGFDRWCAVMGGSESIRDYIAFPKNNAGRDVMIDSPSVISEAQLNELNLRIVS